jgi:hypothetical protein
MDPITASPFSTMTSPRSQVARLIAALVLGAAMGAVLTFAILTQLRPASATPSVGVAVTDGWAHSPITRFGSAYSAPRGGVAVTDGWAHSPITRFGSAYSALRGGVAVTDGWAHSPITRLGSAYSAPRGGVAVTDGWAHSPITRAGGSDERVALLRQLAVSYQKEGPSAEARAR